MRLFNITEIFNNIVTMSASTLDALYDELSKVQKVLKKEGDIDNLRVLRNRIATVLEVNQKKLSHKELKKLNQIRELLDKIDDNITELEAKQKESIQLIDIEGKLDKKYAALKELPKKKKRSHVLIAMRKDEIKYEEEMLTLQMELVKLQRYIQDSGKKVLIIFEGRDAAGKGGSIKRFTENLNPRYAKVVALMKPTDVEKGQWYFERYISHLPNAGEMVFFDRSWYNRAGVEPVMGFVGKRDYEKFIDDVPTLEKMLVNAGIRIVKFYFSISKGEQAERFNDRRMNPLKQYKLSPVDQFSQKLWDRYTLAEYENFTHTHSDHAPWTVINSDDKESARINAIKYLLHQIDYPGRVDLKKIKYDTSIVLSGKEKAKILESEIDKNINLFG